MCIRLKTKQGILRKDKFCSFKREFFETVKLAFILLLYFIFIVGCPLCPMSISFPIHCIFYLTFLQIIMVYTMYSLSCSKKYSKFPRYNMKCRRIRDNTWNIPRSISFTPLHLMLYRGKSITFGTVYEFSLSCCPGHIPFVPSLCRPFEARNIHVLCLCANLF